MRSSFEEDGASAERNDAAVVVDRGPMEPREVGVVVPLVERSTAVEISTVSRCGIHDWQTFPIKPDAPVCCVRRTTQKSAPGSEVHWTIAKLAQNPILAV